MEGKFLGTPLVVWGVLCLAFATVWIIVWPSSKASVTTGMRFVILRWFHALVWLFLSAAAFLAAFDKPGGTDSARAVALLALVTYLVFMGTLVTTR
jgi:hypothetical protein